MQTHKLRIAGSVQDTLILTVYSGHNGSFAIYEDEGNTEGYRKDQYSFTHMTWTDENGAGKLKIEPDGKTFAGQLTERSYQIHIVSTRKPTQVKVNGQNTDWVYDDKNKQVLFSIPKMKIATLNMEII